MAFSSSADLQLRVVLRDFPMELEYDEESGEVTAFNDDLRIMAVGTSPSDAKARFEDALMQWLLEEIRLGLPEAIRKHLAPIPDPPRARSRRQTLARV